MFVNYFSIAIVSSADHDIYWCPKCIMVSMTNITIVLSLYSVRCGLIIETSAVCVC